MFSSTSTSIPVVLVGKASACRKPARKLTSSVRVERHGNFISRFEPAQPWHQMPVTDGTEAPDVFEDDFRQHTSSIPQDCYQDHIR
jgi:hypothetical protein